MITAMHYFAVAFLILGITLEIQSFNNISAGLMLGLGCGYWIQYRQNEKAFDKIYKMFVANELKREESKDEK